MNKGEWRLDVFNWLLILSEQQISIFTSTLLCEFFTISEEYIPIFQKI